MNVGPHRAAGECVGGRDLPGRHWGQQGAPLPSGSQPGGPVWRRGHTSGQQGLDDHGRCSWAARLWDPSPSDTATTGNAGHPCPWGPQPPARPVSPLSGMGPCSPVELGAPWRDWEGSGGTGQEGRGRAVGAVVLSLRHSEGQPSLGAVLLRTAASTLLSPLNPRWWLGLVHCRAWGALCCPAERSHWAARAWGQGSLGPLEA